MSFSETSHEFCRYGLPWPTGKTYTYAKQCQKINASEEEEKLLFAGLRY